MLGKSFYARWVFLINVLIVAYGHQIKLSESCNSRRGCFKIDQATKTKNCTLGSITADIGEKIIEAPPDDEFFLPESPRSVQLGWKNATHAYLRLVPSRAGLYQLKYFLFQVIQEADGPMVYTEHILVNVSSVQIKRESTFNYSCIYVHPGAFRVFVKVWALSGTTKRRRQSTVFKKGSYSMKMSNYLTVPQGRIISASTNSTLVLIETNQGHRSSDKKDIHIHHSEHEVHIKKKHGAKNESKHGTDRRKKKEKNKKRHSARLHREHC